jgi:DNA-binding SARP family transcriptional activator
MTTGLPRLDIWVLGEPELLLDGEHWRFRVPRATWSVLTLLLLHARPLDRAFVASTLWPEQEGSRARATLRRHIHLLASKLPRHVAWIAGDRRTIAWNHAAPYRADMVEFKKCIKERRLADAVDLYAGDLLGSLFDESLHDQRERLHATYVEALAALVTQMLEKGRYNEAMSYAQRALGADEWREDCVRALMIARFRSGDRLGALLTYERFARRAFEELGAEPMPETIAARDGVLAGTLGAEPASPYSFEKTVRERALR